MRVASTSCAGVRSPVQLMSRGAVLMEMVKPSFRYRSSIRPVRWLDSTTGPGCFESHSAARVCSSHPNPPLE